jgi:short chain dehydrogenase
VSLVCLRLRQTRNGDCLCKFHHGEFLPVNLNSRGVFLTNQVAARYFLQANTGVIVNTASLAAKVGAPFFAHYSASKFAVLGWTQDGHRRSPRFGRPHPRRSSTLKLQGLTRLLALVVSIGDILAARRA